MIYSRAIGGTTITQRYCSQQLLKFDVGRLPAVDSLTLIAMGSAISLTWTPPFSLDIPNVDPDIAGYCVDVVNSTSSLVIHSKCGITATQYNYNIIVSPNDIVCDNYTFTVTPVNAVGNGTSASVTLSGKFYIGKYFTGQKVTVGNLDLISYT